MKLLLTLSALLASALAANAFSVQACRWPMEFWCTDVRIATACGVLAQCNAIEAMKIKYGNFEYADAPPVDLGLYIESLCPDCRQFITEQFTPTWLKASSIMNVTIVPYGNAREQFADGHWQYTCQHGSEECVGNVIETCALNLYSKPSAFQLIGCIEASNVRPIDRAAEKCAAQQPELNFTRIMQCANSQEGELLEHQMALLTDSLVPKHQYVPWITLNGVHTDEIQQKAQDDLLGLICATYQGQKPDFCTKQVRASTLL